MSDAIEAAYDRASRRFAKSAGIQTEAAQIQDIIVQAVNEGVTETDQVMTRISAEKFNSIPSRMEIEAMIKQAHQNKAKTAASENGGSQNQTMVDRGDYGSHSEALSAQTTETRGKGKEGTDEAGTQNQTANYQDKNYTQTGSGDAKLATIKTVMALASIDPKAAALFMRTAADGDMGPQMGGEPASVAAGEEEVQQETAPQATDAAPAAAGPTPDQQAAVKLQEKVKEKTDQLTIDKAVTDQLQDVLKDISALKRRNVLLEKRLAARRLRIAVTLQQELALAEEFIAKHPEAAKAAGPLPNQDDFDDRQEFSDVLNEWWTGALDTLLYTLGDEAAAAEWQSKLAVKSKKTALDTSARGKESPTLEQGAGKVPHASTDPSDLTQADGDPDWTLYDTFKQADESKIEPHSGQEFAQSSSRGYSLASLKASLKVNQAKLNVQANELRKSGKSNKEIVAELLATSLGQQTQKLASMVKKAEAEEKAKEDKADAKKDEKKEKDAKRTMAAGDGSGKDVGGNTPPDEAKHNEGDDTSRYDNDSKGDTSEDAISKGTDTTLTSPETSSVVGEARSEMDSKHSSDVKGATTASFTAQERNQLIANRNEAVKLAKLVAAASAKLSTIITKTASKTVDANLAELSADYKTIITRFDKAYKTANRSEIRALLPALVALNKSAKRELKNLSAVTNDVMGAREKLARISPAFQLALCELQAGVISAKDIPGQVSKYAKLSGKEFGLVKETTLNMLSKSASRQTAKTASAIPSVNTDPVRPTAPADELDGIFE